MKRLLAGIAALAAFRSPLFAQADATSPTPKPAASSALAPAGLDEKALYDIGASVAKSLSGLDLTPAEAASVLKGIEAGLAGKANDVDFEAARAQYNALVRGRAAGRLEKEKARGKAFVENASRAPHAVAWPSGLVYTEVAAGTGESPGASDTVKVRYRGTLVDGTEFDNSAKGHDPATFPVNNVIRCWTEGLQKMKVGGKARLVCPPDIAYGERGAAPVIPPGATLVFDLELVDVVKATPSNAGTPSPTSEKK
jgi:FKBP-type peptidyl-prolyl cis-trans isomerase FkpA